MSLTVCFYILEHPYFWGCLSGAVGSVDVWCRARRSCRGRGFDSRKMLNIYSVDGSHDLVHSVFTVLAFVNS